MFGNRIPINTNVDSTPPDPSFEVRALEAINFLFKVKGSGKWVLISPEKGNAAGATKVLSCGDVDGAKGFMKSRMTIGRPVGILLSEAPSFVGGSSVPRQSLGRCQFIAVEAEGDTTELRAVAETWPQWAASLTMDSGLIFVWRLHLHIESQTCARVAQMIAASFHERGYQANATDVLMLPEATRGVHYIEFYDQIMDENGNEIALALQDFVQARPPQPQGVPAGEDYSTIITSGDHPSGGRSHLRIPDGILEGGGRQG